MQNQQWTQTQTQSNLGLPFSTAHFYNVILIFEIEYLWRSSWYEVNIKKECKIEGSNNHFIHISTSWCISRKFELKKNSFIHDKKSLNIYFLIVNSVTVFFNAVINSFYSVLKLVQFLFNIFSFFLSIIFFSENLIYFSVFFLMPSNFGALLFFN